MPQTLRPLLLGSAAVVVVLLTAAPAAAHPFGPPPVARLAMEGTTVTVTWSAQPNDLTALGYATGAFPERQVFTFDAQGRQVEDASSPSQDEQLSEAPQIADYLGEHIGVRQGDTACDATAVDTTAITQDGARLTYDCPEPVTSVELTITTLTDLSPAYRTVGLVDGGSRELFTEEEPTQTVNFGSQPRSPLTALATPAAGLVTGMAVGAAILVLRRRRKPA